jgi:hypothetical protein
MNRRTLALGLMVFVSAALQAPSVEAQAGVTDPEAYAVYRSLPLSAGSEIVVRQETIVNPTCSAGGSAFERDWRGVLENYRRENARGRTLVAELFGSSSFRVVPESVLSKSFGPGFFGAFPNGYRRFSAIGFDATRTRALVYVERIDRLGTRGESMAREKIDGQWVLSTRRDIELCTMIVD